MSEQPILYQILKKMVDTKLQVIDSRGLWTEELCLKLQAVNEGDLDLVLFKVYLDSVNLC